MCSHAHVRLSRHLNTCLSTCLSSWARTRATHCLLWRLSTKTGRKLTYLCKSLSKHEHVQQNMHWPSLPASLDPGWQSMVYRCCCCQHTAVFCMQLDTIVILSQCLRGMNDYRSDPVYKLSGLPHNAMHLLLLLFNRLTKFCQAIGYFVCCTHKKLWQETIPFSTAWWWYHTTTCHTENQ